MKFFAKKYNFNPKSRIFIAGLSSILFLFIILGIHFSLLVNAIENFKTESLISITMNISKLVYEKFGSNIETATEKKSWLSFFDENEENLSFGLFESETKKNVSKKEKTDKTKESENKLRDFSYVLGSVISNYGNPKSYEDIALKNLYSIEVIVGEKLVASSDISSLEGQIININNLFRVKKDSIENNFVVEERKPGFFAGYDKVTKAFTFKDSDITVGVSYIEKPPIVPISSLLIFLFFAIIISLIFLPLAFIPEKYRIYSGIIVIILISIIVYNFYSNSINILIKTNAEFSKKFSEELFSLLTSNNLSLEKGEFLESISQPVGDIKTIKIIDNGTETIIDNKSIEYYLGIFRGVFTGFFVFALLSSVGIFYYFSRGGLEKWLNAFYNYSIVYIFILIALTLVIVLIGIPFFFTIIMSFTSLSRYLSDLNLARQFVGLSNYSDILNFNHILARIGFDWAQEALEKSQFFVRNFGSFYDVLVNTFLYTFISVILQLVLGITFAVILNDNKVKFRGVYQVLLIIPWVIPTYISALLWREALGQYGVFKQFFDTIGLTGFDISASSITYFLSICFVSAWYAFPFIMIVALSGLQGISESVKDAALIDGAGWFTRLFSIYLPLIRPTLLPSVILSSIWTFNNFNIVYLFTRGDDRYDILITRIYDFVSRPDLRVFTYGYASAYSVLVFAILLIYILAFARITRLTEKTY
ncbi:MAG: carbohydrate ABC transporter permease [Brevinematia bacterium]